MRIFATAMLVMLCLASPALADDENSLRLPPDGHVIVNLSATETKRMPQDMLVASLRIELDDKTPAKLQDRINEAMKKALEFANAQAGLKTETGSYGVYQINPEPIPASGRVKKGTEIWRGSQTITIKSTDSQAVLDVTGKIQGLGFAMNALEYTLSPEKQEAVQDELLEKALNKLKGKAALIAKTLGKSGYDLVDVNVNDGGIVPYYAKAVMMRADMAMAESVAPPVAQAGESDVSLSVSARAMIKP